MAFQYYDLTVNVNIGGFPMANVFRLRAEDPTEANEFSQAKQIINELSVGAGPTAWLFRYRAMLSEMAYVSNILCRRASTGGGNTAEAVLQIDTLPGLAAGDVAASQVAACLIWANDDIPDKTGRTFIPAISIEDIGNGRFTSDFRDRAEDFIARHITGLATAGGTFFPVTFDSEFDVGYEITGGYLSPKVGTQRRRETRL